MEMTIPPKLLHRLLVNLLRLAATPRAEKARRRGAVQEPVVAGQVRVEVAARGLVEVVADQALMEVAQEPAVAAAQEETAPAREPAVGERNLLRPQASQGGSMVQ